ncbi:F-box protein At2g23160-like isoform X2 [Rutidosis leptorrhynchoides]|uniref:F-box protein At2g23160-like isoform X2 n=1 Tax=Rutidosis leptorrhynchoides TaxID=125765 RepID=UPI003A997A3C
MVCDHLAYALHIFHHHHMEQASPIVRCCNNTNRTRKVKEAKSGHNLAHNPPKKMQTSSGGSIYHHHKKQKRSTRVVSAKNKIMGDDELPVDNIYNILSRMPLKSLACFQCVSKVWCNYINDPYLEIIMHNAKRAAMNDDPTMLIMFNLKLYPYASASLTMLVTKPEEEKSAATSHEEVVITTKQDPPTPYMKFDCKNWGPRFFTEFDIILGSCKGLIFSSQDNNVDDGTTVLLVINPLKKECYKLPPIKIWSCTSSAFQEREACGLGFDDSTNTYKMVCVVLRNQDKIRSYYDDDDVVKEDLCTMVHDVVLGGTANSLSSSSSSSWREIPAVPAYPISGEAVFANGCLHWLAGYHLKYCPCGAPKKLVCFDMMKEEFGLIDPPNTLDDRYREHLVDLDGQVGLVYDDIRRTCFIEVWLLNYKTKCWVLHCRFDKKPPLPLNMFIKVIGYWNNKDDAGDLLITDNCRRRLFIYRLKHGVLHEANFIYQGFPPARADIRLYQPTFSSILRRCSING